MSLRKHGSNALHPQLTGECSFAAVKVALVAYPAKQLPAPCTEGNHVHEKEGAVRCSRLGIKKTPLVRTITGLYITYGERKQLASI